MEAVSKTLYIPLCGKAMVSRKGIILRDPKAEEIWSREAFPLKGKSGSKWLAYYMAMRAAVFDRWVIEQMERLPGAVVIHIGCGMDSRFLRAGNSEHFWFDLDFPEVIRQRRKYFTETDVYKMLDADVTDLSWLDRVCGDSAIVVMEGVSMYLEPDELKRVLEGICNRFDRTELFVDCYSTFAAKASKVKNPINDVGVWQVYGLDDPKFLETDTLRFLGEWEITPKYLID